MGTYEILEYFPREIAYYVSEKLKIGTNRYEQLEEIRLRNEKPLILKFCEGEEVFKHVVTKEDLLQTLERICDHSIYSYQNQICNGFVTVRGGHRVGIAGNVVMENQKIKNINYISGLNFRVARQMIGCSRKVWNEIIDPENQTVYNTLIVSAPGARKNYIIKRFNETY